MKFIQSFVKSIDEELEKMTEGDESLIGTLEKMKKDLLEKGHIEEELFKPQIIKKIFFSIADRKKHLLHEKGLSIEKGSDYEVIKLMQKDLFEKGYIEKRRWAEFPSEKEFDE